MQSDCTGTVAIGADISCNSNVIDIDLCILLHMNGTATVGVISTCNQCTLDGIISVVIVMPHIVLNRAFMLCLRILLTDNIQNCIRLDKKYLTASLRAVQPSVNHKTVHIDSNSRFFINSKYTAYGPVIKHCNCTTAFCGIPGFLITLISDRVNLCNVSSVRSSKSVKYITHSKNKSQGTYIY